MSGEVRGTDHLGVVRAVNGKQLVQQVGHLSGQNIRQYQYQLGTTKEEFNGVSRSDHDWELGNISEKVTWFKVVFKEIF